MLCISSINNEPLEIIKREKKPGAVTRAHFGEELKETLPSFFQEK